MQNHEFLRWVVKLMNVKYCNQGGTMEIHELVGLEQLKIKKINYIQFPNSRELKPIDFSIINAIG